MKFINHKQSLQDHFYSNIIKISFHKNDFKFRKLLTLDITITKRWTRSLHSFSEEELTTSKIEKSNEKALCFIKVYIE